MKAKRKIALAAALLSGAALVGIAALRGNEDGGEPSRCGPGLVALGARCCGAGQKELAGRCTGAPATCGPAHDLTQEGCVPRRSLARIAVPGGHLHIGPGDWEAQGVVAPHDAEVAPFAMDAFEITCARWSVCAAAGKCQKLGADCEPGVPVTGVTFDEAAAFCAFAGGRLPSRDELAFAISGEVGRRYPWGDTGAVCRRGAWGLASGPCANGGTGPDLAGAHPDGRSPLGAFDLAGNVAEWAVSPDAREGFADALGGSWADSEAAALRGWNRRPVQKSAREPTIGLRCVYNAN